VEAPPTVRPFPKLNRSRFSPEKTYTTESPRRKRNGHDSQRRCRPHHTPRIMGDTLPKDKHVRSNGSRGVSSAVAHQRTSASVVSSAGVVVTPSRPASSKKETCAAVRTVSPPLVPSTLYPATSGHYVYLIRHGESNGQLVNSMQRRGDLSLVDCGLSALGQQQARSMKERHNLPPMDMILSSPLTRALQTAVLAFPTATQIFVNYDLREFGGGNKGGRSIIPENQPRPWNQVFADLPPDSHFKIDIRSFAQEDRHHCLSWPNHHATSPIVLRRRYIHEVFRSLAAQMRSQRRPRHIAVVCHFHVIRAALTDPEKGFCDSQIQPINATPISCYLTSEGRLILC
jgi:broad specificity phosphatase PhoE